MNSDNIIPLFSFNACGWLYIFQIGVVSMLQEATYLDKANAHGTSAGASAAACICLDFPGEFAGEEMCKQQFKSREDFLKMVNLMKDGIERLTPINGHEIVNERLCVSCTEITSISKFEFNDVEFRKFNTRKELVDILSATAHVPILGGYEPFLYKGRWLYDGLFTNTHPLVNNKKCFKISWTPNCHCGCTKDMSNNPYIFAPDVNMPLRWCFIPPDDTTLRLIYWHGYCKTREVLLRRDFPRHQLSFKNNAFKNKNYKITEKNIENIIRTPITSATDSDKYFIIQQHSEIRDEINKRIENSENNWTGFIGFTRYTAVIIRVIFPCCPLNSIVNRIINEDQYKKMI